LKTEASYLLQEDMALVKAILDYMLVDRTYNLFASRTYTGRIEGELFIINAKSRGTYEIFGELSDVGSNVRLRLESGLTTFELGLSILISCLPLMFLVTSVDGWISRVLFVLFLFAAEGGAFLTYSYRSKIRIKNFGKDFLNEIEKHKVSQNTTQTT
jgi:hypothetical protein